MLNPHTNLEGWSRYHLHLMCFTFELRVWYGIFCHFRIVRLLKACSFLNLELKQGSHVTLLCILKRKGLKKTVSSVLACNITLVCQAETGATADETSEESGLHYPITFFNYMLDFFFIFTRTSCRYKSIYLFGSQHRVHLLLAAIKQGVKPI